MKKQFKRILALILALAMALSLSITAFAAEAAPETDGNALLRAFSEEADVLWWSIAGPDAVCTFYSNGDLVFSGSGTIDTTHYNWRNNRDNTPSSFPQEYYALVKNIVIDEGITGVGSWCFDLRKFDHPSVYIPSTLKIVEPCGFMSHSCTVPDYTNYLESEIAINRGFEGAGTVYIADMDAWCRCIFKDPLANPGFNADHIIYQGKELTHVDVPNGPKILRSTFAGWKNLESIKLPSSVTSLYSTFFGSGLREIYLPSSVTTLWNTGDNYYQGDAIDETGMYYGSFGSCTRLKNVYMPGVDLVQAYTFTNCTSLNTLVFGSDVGFLHAENWGSHDVFFTNCPSTLTIYATKNYPEFKGFNYKSLTSTITASNFTKTSSTSSQKFNLGVKTLDNAKLTYSTASKKVTIDKSGNVTIPAKYVGKLTIKIKAAATDKFPERTKSITLTVNPSKTTLNSVSNAKGKKMTVKWKKNTLGSGYQIQYSTRKDFSSGVKSVTIGKNSTVSKTITGLTKGKTYYVRVRTLKTVSGVKYYSGWSAVKSVKISK